MPDCVSTARCKTRKPSRLASAASCVSGQAVMNRSHTSLLQRLQNPADRLIAWRFSGLLLCVEAIGCAVILQRISCKPVGPYLKADHKANGIQQHLTHNCCRHRDRLDSIHAASAAVCKGNAASQISAGIAHSHAISYVHTAMLVVPLNSRHASAHDEHAG